ncbi:MAG: bifunctional folylpolyglutamate synthase/dihydrofolate synthase [Bacteroidales bacterium]|nr:bifunctional folylpolyglutamate synthase/dihydrofolate synthase [Bacteroidales bacterium]
MDRYEEILSALFVRFPSVTKAGFSAAAYKPGLEHMQAFDALLGYLSGTLRTLHVAGTNGKGSVSSMLASALAAQGLRVGLFTSPHLLDFRERIKIVEDEGYRLIPRGVVLDFVDRWSADFNRLSLSFFEITTGMAFDWFVREEVDIAVIEVGLGGRLDSTNIVTPELSVVTSIGLDHCAQLGATRAAIAREKAGIFKPGVPALVGEWDAETAPVFESVAAAAPCPLFFAEDFVGADGGRLSPSGGIPRQGSSSLPEGDSLPRMQEDRESSGGCVLQGAGVFTPPVEGAQEGTAVGQALDLHGAYQALNLRTVLAALDLLGVEPDWEALSHTAARTGLRGRWETLYERPLTICDIGHNPPALRYNFAQIEAMMASGRFARLHIIYGVMADKALDDILPLMPREAHYCFVTPDTPRALPAADIAARFASFRAAAGSGVAPSGDRAVCGADGVTPFGECAAESTAPGRSSVSEGIRKTLELAGPDDLIYIGGSTFVVCEAIAYFETI